MKRFGWTTVKSRFERPPADKGTSVDDEEDGVDEQDGVDEDDEAQGPTARDPREEDPPPEEVEGAMRYGASWMLPKYLDQAFRLDEDLEVYSGMVEGARRLADHGGSMITWVAADFQLLDWYGYLSVDDLCRMIDLSSRVCELRVARPDPDRRRVRQITASYIFYPASLKGGTYPRYCLEKAWQTRAKRAVQQERPLED